MLCVTKSALWYWVGLHRERDRTRKHPDVQGGAVVFPIENDLNLIVGGRRDAE